MNVSYRTRIGNIDGDDTVLGGFEIVAEVEDCALVGDVAVLCIEVVDQSMDHQGSVCAIGLLQVAVEQSIDWVTSFMQGNEQISAIVRYLWDRMPIHQIDQ
jgi:hypothetical protein